MCTHLDRQRTLSPTESIAGSAASGGSAGSGIHAMLPRVMAPALLASHTKRWRVKVPRGAWEAAPGMA